MATILDILQLFAEPQVEAEPGPTLPTLLGSDQRAAELVDGEDVGHSKDTCRATSRDRAGPAHFPHCWVAINELQSSWVAKIWDILQRFAELQAEAEPGPHASHIAG